MSLHSSTQLMRCANSTAALEAFFFQRRTAQKPPVLYRQARALHISTRSASGATTASTEKLVAFDTAPVATPPSKPARPLRKLSTPALLRSIMLSQVFARPWVASIGMKALNMIAKSRQPFLDPDRNWILGKILRATVFNQFCAGPTREHVMGTIKDVKNVGFAGVLLCYAREIVAQDLAESSSVVDISAKQIQQWHDGNLQTLSMLGSGDYAALKYSGAGGSIAEALKSGANPPEQFWSALNELCSKAKAQGTMLLVDAEEQVFQPTIDRWTVDLMRKFNQGDEAYVLNTYQGYLKCTPSVLQDHLRLAAQEGWTMGVKLVRGAYILIEKRNLIHDTKADTDACYDGIVKDILQGSSGSLTADKFPNVRFLICGHNAESIRKATHLRKELLRRGINSGKVEFAQLLGMADHVSGELLAQSEASVESTGLSEEEILVQKAAAPQVFKCVNWGSVRECLGFLIRRAAENQGSTDRLLDGLEASKKELWVRIMRRA